MHGSKQRKSWHGQPSLRAVLPAKHGMLWGKQLGKQETQSLYREFCPSIFPLAPTLMISQAHLFETPPL